MIGPILNKLSLLLALAILLLCASVFAPAASGRVPTRPKLLYTWWRKSQRPAVAVGFISSSVAVVALRSGPEIIGAANGTPLYRYNDITLAQDRMIGREPGRRPPAWGVAALRTTGVENPTRMALPSGWASNAIYAGVALAARSRILAVGVRSSAGVEGVCLWNLAEKKVIGIIRNPRNSGPALALAFSPDGKRLAIGYSSSARRPGRVDVWSVPTAKSVLKLVPPIRTPTWDPLGIEYVSANRLAITTQGGIVYLADLARLRLLAAPRSAVRMQENWVTMTMAPSRALLLPHQSRILFTAPGIVRPSIYICDAKSGRILHRLLLRGQPAPALVSGLARAPQPGCVIVGVTYLAKGLVGYFAEIRLPTGKTVWRSPDMSGGCASLAVSPGGRAAVTCGLLGTRLWRLPPAQLGK